MAVISEQEKNNKDTQFLEQVYKKEDKAYETCRRLFEQKIKYATILLSLSGIEKLYKLRPGIHNDDVVGIFILLVPLVVYCFDPLILAENNNIRVVGKFLKGETIFPATNWNNLWAKEKWKNLFLWGSYSVSCLAFIISCVFYIALYPISFCDISTGIILWGLSNIILLLVLLGLYIVVIRKS
jgi:hypothetical protein